MSTTPRLPNGWCLGGAQVAPRWRDLLLEEPGRRLLVRVLEGGDLVLLLEGQADVVKPVEEAVLAERVHLSRREPIGTQTTRTTRFSAERHAVEFFGAPKLERGGRATRCQP
eukprot:9494984-Pyramimonas_sp.AAC.1